MTNATSAILGVGLPGQRLTVTVACWEFAPQSAHFEIEGERVQDDGTRAWFDVGATWALTDVDGACAWCFQSMPETLLFADHQVGWRVRLVGVDQGGFGCEWNFTIQGE